TNDLPNITVPALIIAADRDRLTRPFASQYMKDNLPNAQLVTVAPGNHQGLVERHVEVNRAAEEFVGKLGSQSKAGSHKS
ncbi:MAG TPA: alpha/beta hydrolase, partial [Flavisolibacter sp.]